MNSAIIDGQVLDFYYKKLQDNHYAFYVGDILVGQVLNTRSGWAAVSNKVVSPFGPVYGFRSRYHASEFLLKFCGIWKE